MNIFVLHQDPVVAAAYHCDSHVVKMILETGQLLTPRLLIDSKLKKFAPCKPTHWNHPCSVWVREHDDNYQWLKTLGIALCDQYEKRYGRRHSWYARMRKLPDLSKSTHNKTSFALAMPEEYALKNPVAAYRLYYLLQKSHFASYRNCKVPSWYTKHFDWELTENRYHPNYKQLLAFYRQSRCLR